ncbi:DinB family protein [Micromonospora sp. C28SCA-DRY-2]|uniref:DinB family protein n=1 Tax=Micromonospora sp. C28SCA-DRY-2 TaxID=3059522 RepID=UPI0026747705|nr:DinB family protein [Micromonospora sp. C28SCA-DRY-2]MDO3704026.1 DinB family protein [Micromonospora sp. C28SCA-DRY-2]
MAAEHADTDAFRGATFRHADLAGAAFRNVDLAGATFHSVDLAGATVRDSNLSGVRIVASAISDLRVSRHAGRGTVVVDDVDVTAYVAAELDRRHPERVRLRAVRTADDVRAMWDTLERLWAETLARAERLPEAALHERVDDEWSFVETLRHLVFATDVWVGRVIRGEPTPYHRLGLPPTDTSPAGAAELGIDLAARPAYAEVVAVFADRRRRVREVVAAVTDAELAEMRTAELTPEWGVESHPVGECLRVVLEEHCEHRRFAVRDLAVLEARGA